MSERKPGFKAVVALTVGAVAVSMLTALPSAIAAETATGGASVHKDHVFWWTAPGSGSDDFGADLLAAGREHSSTTTAQIGDSTFELTCTISNLGVDGDGNIVAPGLATKVPGNANNQRTAKDKAGWKGESFPLLYNSGDSPNLLANGLTFFHKSTGASGMYTRLVPSHVKAEAGKADKPWTEQVRRFGGVVNDNGDIVTNPATWPTETEFDLSCSVTVDGESVPLEGLVVANAESNGNQAPTLEESEHQVFTPLGEGADTATWHVLDIWDSCKPYSYRASDVYDVGADNSLTNHPIFGPNTSSAGNGADDVMPECPNAANKSFSSSVLLKGVTAMHVKMHEDSGSAGSIAVGVYLASDFGDAPSSYGVAGNYWSGTWDNALAKGSSTVLTEMPNRTHQGGPYYTGSSTEPNYYLGAKRDTENPASITLNKQADADDTHSREGTTSDEDSFVPGLDADLSDDLSTSNGTTTYSTEVACTANGGTGYVGGWIDWDLDGTFNTGAEQATATCQGGKATLTWNVPSNKIVPFLASDEYGNPEDPWSYLRLRISSNQADIKPSGIGVAEGEVEDYRVTWDTPVTLKKTSYVSPSGADMTANTTYGWEVTLTNTGNLDYTSAYPMQVLDDLTDAYTHLDSIRLVSVQSGGMARIDSDAKDLMWTGPLKAGASVTIKYEGTIANYGDGTISNSAKSHYDPSSEKSVSDKLSKLEVTKEASATAVNLDGTVDYTITVKNTGLAAAKSGSFVDDLSDVIDDGEVIATSVTATKGTATLDGNNLTWTLGDGGSIDPGQSVTITYKVKFNNATGNSSAYNKVCLANPYNDLGEQCASTTTEVRKPPVGEDRVTVGKKGEPQSTTIEDMFTKGTGDITDYTLVDKDGNAVDTVTIPGQGTYTIADGKVVFTPEPGFSGTPDPVTVRATDANGLTADGKYQPHVLDASTASRTITYRYLTPEGEQASTTVVQTTEFEQVPVLGGDGKPQFNTDGTPQFTWQPKAGQSDTLPAVDSPAITRWNPDKASIPAVQVNPGDTLNEVVVYQPEPPTATPAETYGGKDQPQTGAPQFEVTTPTTPDGSTNAIEKIELLDADGNPATTVTVPEGTYTLNPDGTITFAPNDSFVGDPTPVKVRGTDKNGKTAETMYTPHVVDNIATKTVKRTINYTYLTEDGEKVTEPVVQEVTFTVARAVDPVTGELSDPNWSDASPQTLPAVISPDLSAKNWRTDRPEVPALTVNPTDPDMTENVVYNTPWVKYVDGDGNTVYLPQTGHDKDGNEPPAPRDPTKRGYTFAGWDRSVDDEGNVTYTARWTPAANSLASTGLPSAVALILVLAGALGGAGFLLRTRRKHS